MTSKTLIWGFSLSFLLFAQAGILSAQSSRRLADAAKQGDKAVVNSLIESKADVNAAQGDGMTALHWAAFRDDLEIAQMLIRAGANVKAATRDGAITPLFMACTNGSAAMIDLLLKAGADAKETKGNGTTALMTAAASGNADAVKVLLDHGADVNVPESAYGQTALMFAAALNRAAVVKLLASRGANLNLASNVTSLRQTRYGESADPNAPPNSDEPRSRAGATPLGGMTALLFASRDGHLETVHTLVEAGADINQVSGDKSSSLVLAIINGHYDVANYLLNHGADPNLASTAGLAALYATIDAQWAPLGWAPNPITAQEKVGYLELMKSLLDHGANPNERLTQKLWFRPLTHDVGWVDSVGATAFWRAAQSTDLDAMKMLVARGADPNIPTRAGDTPLMVATGIGWGGNFTLSPPDSWMPAVTYLVELHADVNAADNRGYTALGGAAFRGNNEMVQYLIAKGARIDAVAKDGNTIADMANGIAEHAIPHPDTVVLLEKLGSANSNKCKSNECLVAPVEKVPVKRP